MGRGPATVAPKVTIAPKMPDVEDRTDGDTEMLLGDVSGATVSPTMPAILQEIRTTLKTEILAEIDQHKSIDVKVAEVKQNLHLASQKVKDLVKCKDVLDSVLAGHQNVFTLIFCMRCDCGAIFGDFNHHGLAYLTGLALFCAAFQIVLPVAMLSTDFGLFEITNNTWFEGNISLDNSTSTPLIGWTTQHIDQLVQPIGLTCRDGEDRVSDWVRAAATLTMMLACLRLWNNFVVELPIMIELHFAILTHWRDEEKVPMTINDYCSHCSWLSSWLTETHLQCMANCVLQCISHMGNCVSCICCCFEGWFAIRNEIALFLGVCANLTASVLVPLLLLHMFVLDELTIRDTLLNGLALEFLIDVDNMLVSSFVLPPGNLAEQTKAIVEEQIEAALRKGDGGCCNCDCEFNLFDRRKTYDKVIGPGAKILLAVWLAYCAVMTFICV